MHELGITRNIVSIVAEAAGSNPVARVSVKIGEFSAVLPDALHFCFDSCTHGTVLEPRNAGNYQRAGQVSLFGLRL